MIITYNTNKERPNSDYYKNIEEALCDEQKKTGLWPSITIAMTTIALMCTYEQSATERKTETTVTLIRVCRQSNYKIKE